MPTCLAPQSHIVDSCFYSQGYTTHEARGIFCAVRRAQRWLDVEVALASCQADLGLIPREAANKLSAGADITKLDINAVRVDISRTGHSLIPLLNAWQKVAGDDAGQFIHYGATTQDIQDTAQSLEVKDVITIIRRDLAAVIAEISKLAAEHKDTVVIGRTHGQHALPTTLGLKMAVWLDELLRHSQRLEECSSRLLVSQLFGGVGTMDAFADKGPELLVAFSAKLKLTPAAVAWHTSRDRLAEFLSLLALITGTCAKIANEIVQLSRDEIGEMEEPFHMGKIGSTTMPHKRNPELCEQIIVLAKLIKSSAGLGFDGLINEHERDYRAVRLEWVSITDASLFACGALDLMKKISAGLIIRKENIQLNLEKSAGLISTEALMFMLGNKIGKQTAHTLLYDLAMQARKNGQPLLELLLAEEQIMDKFSAQEIKQAMDPAAHIGAAAHLTNQILSQAKTWQNSNKDNDSVIKCPLADSQSGCPINSPFPG